MYNSWQNWITKLASAGFRYRHQSCELLTTTANNDLSISSLSSYTGEAQKTPCKKERKWCNQMQLTDRTVKQGHNIFRLITDQDFK